MKKPVRSKMTLRAVIFILEFFLLYFLWFRHLGQPVPFTRLFPVACHS